MQCLQGLQNKKHCSKNKIRLALKNLIALIWVIILSNQAISQKSQLLNVTDTTLIVGIIKEGTFGGDLGSYCLSPSDKYFDAKTPVIIAGAKQCKRSYSSDNYFEVIYQNKNYFVKEDALVTKYDNLFQVLSDLPTNLADSFRSNAIHTGSLLQKAKLNNVIKFLEASKPKGLVVLQWKPVDESEYTSGTGIEFTFYNPGKKTIKYLWISVVGYNAVDDKVIERGTSVKTVKCVGPITGDATAEYNFDYVWFTDLVSTAKITSIKIQYMDGAFKSITDPSSIIMSDSDYEIFNSVSNDD